VDLAWDPTPEALPAEQRRNGVSRDADPELQQLPWIRCSHHLGFSRASRRIMLRISELTSGVLNNRCAWSTSTPRASGATGGSPGEPRSRPSAPGTGRCSLKPGRRDQSSGTPAASLGAGARPACAKHHDLVVLASALCQPSATSCRSLRTAAYNKEEINSGGVVPACPRPAKTGISGASTKFLYPTG
jgi:hypothetical protein